MQMPAMPIRSISRISTYLRTRLQG